MTHLYAYVLENSFSGVFRILCMISGHVFRWNNETCSVGYGYVLNSWRVNRHLLSLGLPYIWRILLTKIPWGWSCIILQLCLTEQHSLPPNAYPDADSGRKSVSFQDSTGHWLRHHLLPNFHVYKSMTRLFPRLSHTYWRDHSNYFCNGLDPGNIPVCLLHPWNSPEIQIWPLDTLNL